VTAVLDHIPVRRISGEARRVDFGRTVLTVIAAVFYAIGWSLSTLWLAVAWCGVAVKVGWQEARSGGTRRPAG